MPDSLSSKEQCDEHLPTDFGTPPSASFLLGAVNRKGIATDEDAGIRDKVCLLCPVYFFQKFFTVDSDCDVVVCGATFTLMTLWFSTR